MLCMNAELKHVIRFNDLDYYMLCMNAELKDVIYFAFSNV